MLVLDTESYQIIITKVNLFFVITIISFSNYCLLLIDMQHGQHFLIMEDSLHCCPRSVFAISH